ncbi:MAG TPA: transglycosylase domain-containing protein [Solirubrobacteraceae bacterium]|nr:transglycosylase domain-containing protein [Solirubrobacteraceae bacterium]
MSVEHGSNITPLFGDHEPPEPPPAKRPRVKKRRLLAIILPLGLLAIVSTAFGMMMAVASDLPNLENRKEYQDARNSELLDSQGNSLGVLTNNQSRVLVRYEDISSYMRNAIIAIEDRRFYENSGVDVRGIGRALVQDVLSRQTVQGGSTIAQQFVKNALRAQSDRTVFQKMREAALAYHLTRKWPKSKILTQYLNSIYFGNGAYGVESAARTYFGNQPDHQDCGTRTNLCVKELRPEEAALIAGVVANPTAYDPVAHPQAALERRNLVLKDMFDQGLLPRAQYLSARVEALPAPVDIKPPTVRTKAPYFTTWVRQQLVDQFGARKAFEGGLKVKTTLDLKLQDAAEKAVNTYLPNANGPSAAVVAIDNQTGAVRAMVGGRDYATRPFNLATQGQRQPGSAIKPFILAAALRKGYAAGSLWPSRKRVFTVPGTKGREKFVVNNFESKYAGSRTLAGGLTYSDNAVFSAVGISVGTKKIASLAERMGIRTPVSSNYAMTLGGLHQGVTPLDMAHAYETFIEHGRRIGGTLGAGDDGPVGIDEVLTPKGKVLKENHRTTTPVLEHNIADQTVGIMTTVISQGTGTRAALGPGKFAAGKTGTTENSGDAWFVGFNERWTVAVWVGYADKLKPMLTEFAGAPVEGGTYPALIWHDFMVQANAIADARNAKDRERRGLPPKPPEDTQTTTTPAPVIPTKPAPVPEGGAGAPPAAQTPAAPKTGTAGGGSATGTSTGATTQPPAQTTTQPPAAGATGGTSTSGGASAPP